ncbi:MAG: ABC transporter permease [Treponema sp.]|nr:ABC transporter permease [Treponema sp.]
MKTKDTLGRATLRRATLRRSAPQRGAARFAASGAILCCAGLCVPAFVAGRACPPDLFIAAPADIHAPAPGLQKVGRFCDEQFPLTYEIPAPGTARVLGAEYPVTVVGTNSHYPRILGLPMTAGSFFSGRAQKNGERRAVLNGKAAFDLFGASRAAGRPLKLGGETWIVTGVLHDGDDETRRIYVPARDGAAAALAARAAGGAAQDSLKPLGLYGYMFFDMGARMRFLRERAAVAFMLLSCLVPALLIPPALGRCRAAFSRPRGEIDSLRDLFRPGPVRLSASVLAPPACAAAILVTLRRVAAICLRWQDLPALGSLDRRALFPGIAAFQSCETASGLLFLLFLAFFAACCAFARRPRTPPSLSTNGYPG